MVGNFTSLNKSWGFIEVYLASWLREFDSTITTSDVHGLLTVVLCAEIIGIMLFAFLNTRFSVKFVTASCLGLSSLGWFIYYYSTSMWILIIASICLGASTSLRQLVVSFIMIEILPNNTGLAAGLAAMSSSFSVALYSSFGEYVMNPHKKNPSIQIIEGERVAKYFDHGVASQFPWYSLYILFMCIFTGII